MTDRPTPGGWRQRLALPLDERRARALRAGDGVLVSGRILTAREAGHRHLLRHPDPRLLAAARGALVYHCAPVVADEGGGRWRVLAAGPSASIREEPYQAALLARYGLRGVIGKGGMGDATLRALQEQGAVYLHAARRAAVTLAASVERVEAVHHLAELGVADAVWVLQVRDFPAVVSMDAHGHSLHVLGATADEGPAAAH